MMVITYIIDMENNTKDGTILVYVCDDIRSNLIECENLLKSFKDLAIEFPFSLKRWSLICS